LRVSGLHIDGFGIFHDTSVEELPAGLTVFVGHNESGKSTLMEFFRYVLFGRPSGHRKNRYPPLRGGRHGGRLLVVTKDGRELTIERSDKQVTLYEPGGGLEKAEPAQRYFGGIERDTFERVFAVGLEDLKGTQVIQEQGISSRLFAAGTGLGERSLPDTLKRLDQGMDALLKHRGRTQEIVQLTTQLSEVTQEIAALGREADEYAASQQRRLDLLERVEQHRQRSEQIRQRWDRLEQLEEAREHWVALRTLRETEAEFAHARQFPPSGLQRFESLGSEIEELEALLEERQDRLSGIEQQLAEHTVDRRVLEARAQIEHLVSERSALAAAQDDLPGVRAASDHRRSEYEQRLRDLGPDWDGKRLATVDTSVQVRQQVQQFADRIQQAQTAVTAAEAQHESRKADAQRAREAVVAAAQRSERLPAPPADRLDIVDARLSALGQMRPRLHEADMLTAQQESRLASRGDVESQLTLIQGQLSAPVAVLPLWLVFAVAIAGIVFAAVLFCLYGGYYIPAWGSVVIAAFVAVALGTLRYRQQAGEAARQNQLDERVEQLSAKRHTLEQEAAQLARRIDAARNHVHDLAADAGLDPPDTLADAERLASRLASQRQQLVDWLAARQDIAAAEREQEAMSDAVARAAQKHQDATAHLGRLTQSWEDWLAERRFATTTAAAQFVLVLEAVEKARDAVSRYEEAQRRVEQIQQYADRVGKQIAEVLRGLGEGAEAESPGVDEIDSLSSRLNEAVQTEQEQRRLADLREEFCSERNRLQRQLLKKQQTRSELMRAAGAEDENEFRRAAEAYQVWQESKLAADEEELTLRTIAGSQEASTALEDELEQTAAVELTEERQRLADEREILRDRVSADEQAIGGIDEQLRRMAHDERLGEKRLAQETLRQQLSDAIQRWAVQAVCRHLLDQAQQVYEQQRQPQVIRRAAGYLDTMTGGRYRLVRSLGESGIQLENAALGRKDEAVWSSGLADQAYLAIRLGLAREFAEYVEPLPVILDDVLVRFDQARREAAARVVLDFAQQQQVLLFSCRNDLAAIVAKAHRQMQPDELAVTYFDVEDGSIRRRE
jgi:uncharacterized protein YhaN